jgi:hypothetical protein
VTSAPVFYDRLAEWWPLFSPPIHYEEEAADLLARLGPVSRSGFATRRDVFLARPA